MGAAMIDNPDYKGPWVHPMIANPEYADDETWGTYDDFGVIGIDIWQVKSGTIFDSIIIADDIADAEAFAKETYLANKDEEKKASDAEREARDAEIKELEEEEDDDVEDEDDDARAEKMEDLKDEL